MVRGDRLPKMSPYLPSRRQHAGNLRLDVAFPGLMSAQPPGVDWTFFGPVSHAASPSTQASQQPFASTRTRPM
jgi:hypothetical protein